MIKLRRLTYIKPVRAIAGGREEVYFKSRLQAPIYKRWMNFWMALRQLTSNKKQYIGATAITALLIFFLMMVTAMNSWLSGDASVLNKMFSYYNSSMTVSYGDDSIRDDVENIIRSDSVIKDKYYMGSKYVCLNNNKMHCTYFENPDFCISVLEGRTCRYENEVLITKFVSKDLGIKIGDTVTVAVDNQSQEFTVSGIYQNGNDMGTNFAMSAKGMERITGNPVWDGYKKYILADETKTNDIVKKIQDKYSEKQVVVYNDRDIDENTQTIITSVKGISVIIYVITGIFVVVIILMICGKIFTRERIDNGIYKAVGFSSKRLRMQFAVRFALIAVIGSFFGLILYALLSGTLLGIIFSYMGFSQVNASTPILGIIIPILFMIIMFMLISYLISNKIKRVHTRILISE
jgi:putative ABC transport system permease protein